MIFPFMDQAEESVSEQKEVIPVEYEINFDTGILTGRIVEGKEAIKMWIFKVLRTQRYKHLIYTWDYGVDLEELINKTYDKAYIESEIARGIEEALLINPYITAIKNFKCTFSGTWLQCDFDVITNLGEVNISEKYPNL